MSKGSKIARNFSLSFEEIKALLDILGICVGPETAGKMAKKINDSEKFGKNLLRRLAENADTYDLFCRLDVAYQDMKE